VGNPCKVVKSITDADKRKLFKNEEIDQQAWDDIIKSVEF
jgi:maltose O-acetyltransferase